MERNTLRLMLGKFPLCFEKLDKTVSCPLATSEYTKGFDILI